mmetsp:Transcript_16947/g.23406  ORF Transcript_16947/g.23406 Transcript_16947/m.23406 type:complete len:351 (+) Transcript_16947:77-1129(+)
MFVTSPYSISYRNSHQTSHKSTSVRNSVFKYNVTHEYRSIQVNASSKDSTSLSALSPPSRLPLYGKRVLITAPRQYASRLATLLIDSGAQPIWVPAIQICETKDHSGLDRELLHLDEYTHVAFTSRNGIAAVLSRLKHVYKGAEEAQAAVTASGVKFCALGRDGQALTDAAFPCHITPTEASTQGLVRYLKSIDEAEGARVLCPVPKVVGLTEPQVIPRFLSALASAGAHPTRVDSYETAFGCSEDNCKVECQLLVEGSVDAVVFSSTAESEALVKAVGGLDVFQKACVDHNILLAAHGPYTAAGASSVVGLPVPCVSQKFSSFEGVVIALGQTFAGTYVATPALLPSTS